MRADEIERKLETLKQRLAALGARAEEGDVHLTEALPRTLADSQASLQELHAAQEELAARHEALAGDRERSRWSALSASLANHHLGGSAAQGSVRGW